MDSSYRTANRTHHGDLFLLTPSDLFEKCLSDIELSYDIDVHYLVKPFVVHISEFVWTKTKSVDGAVQVQEPSIGLSWYFSTNSIDFVKVGHIQLFDNYVFIFSGQCLQPFGLGWIAASRDDDPAPFSIVIYKSESVTFTGAGYQNRRRIVRCVRRYDPGTGQRHHNKGDKKTMCPMLSWTTDVV